MAQRGRGAIATRAGSGEREALARDRLPAALAEVMGADRGPVLRALECFLGDYTLRGRDPGDDLESLIES